MRVFCSSYFHEYFRNIKKNSEMNFPVAFHFKSLKLLSPLLEVVQSLFLHGATELGDWRDRLLCLPGIRVAGYRIQVQDPIVANGSVVDNSALNGIQLACADGTVTKEAKGPYGKWKEWKYCEGGLKFFSSKYIVAFKLRSEKAQGGNDNTGASNVNFLCNDQTELRGGGPAFGKWETNGYESCTNGNYFCGVQVRIEKDQLEGDDTGLNQMKFLCCHPNLNSKLSY